MIMNHCSVKKLNLESFQGLATFLEEGRYKSMKYFPNLKGVPHSIKLMHDDLGSPELQLFSGSCFLGKNKTLKYF